MAKKVRAESKLLKRNGLGPKWWVNKRHKSLEDYEKAKAEFKLKCGLK
jgi:hypothetical protein